MWLRETFIYWCLVISISQLGSCSYLFAPKHLSCFFQTKDCPHTAFSANWIWKYLVIPSKGRKQCTHVFYGLAKHSGDLEICLTVNISPFLQLAVQVCLWLIKLSLLISQVLQHEGARHAFDWTSSISNKKPRVGDGAIHTYPITDTINSGCFFQTGNAHPPCVLLTRICLRYTWKNSCVTPKFCSFLSSSFCLNMKKVIVASSQP